jgi:hypothetical protein
MRAALLAGLTMAGVGVCAPAVAQQAQVPDLGSGRQHTIGFSVHTTYDTNVAHTNDTGATLRGIKPEDEIVHPAAHFTIVQPIGHQAVFLTGSAGYDFHHENKRLNRRNIDLTGGGDVIVGPCQTTLYGKYAAAQSDLADVALNVTKNTITNTTLGGGLACHIGPRLQFTASGQHEDATNSDTTQKTADHKSDGGSVSITYGSSTLGTVGLIASYSKQKYPNRLVALGQVGDAYWDEMFGIQYQRHLGSKLGLQATVGRTRLHRKFTPVGVKKTTSSINYSITANYRFNNRLSLQLSADRSYQPSNTAGKLYDLNKTYLLEGQYQLSNRLNVSLGGTIEDIHSNFDTSIAAPLVPTNARKKSAYGSIGYTRRKDSLTLTVRHENRTTNLQTFNYSDDKVTLALSVNF